VSLAERVIDRLNRVNAAHPWSHNDAYARFVLRHAARVLRENGTSALDVGCGTGNLLLRLARRFPEVVGIEADPATAALASAAVRTLPNASVVTASFPSGDGRRYDFVSMVAVLHHLPLREGIDALRDAVAPGGHLVIVGVYREERSDAALSIVSVVLNPIVGMLRHPRRAVALPTNMAAPVAPASDSYRLIRDALREELPGVKVRRGLFWRYTAVWRAPR
jgi:2-polyprenyl-3-methyl-5-hydroxy-6-metoxy-1,4-benzoquinol methylase